MARPLQSLVSLVERIGVEVRTGIEATVDVITSLEPDHTIVATGSSPFIPSIPGLDDPLTAEQVLRGEREVGRKVLILGGGLVGIEMAEHLGLTDHQVVVVELLDDTARDMEAITRKMIQKRLQGLPVTIHTKTLQTTVTRDPSATSIRCWWPLVMHLMTLCRKGCARRACR